MGEGLFDCLPHIERLNAEELAFIDDIPAWPTTQAVPVEQEALCRRLERRGFVHVSRERDDPIAVRPTLYAGSTDAGWWLARREHRRRPTPSKDKADG